MQKSSRRVWLTLELGALVVLSAILVLSYHSAEVPLIAQLDSSNIESITLTRGSEVHTLKKISDRKWELDDHRPLSARIVEFFLYSIATSTRRTPGPTAVNHSEFGLNPPSAKISLISPSKTWEILVGNHNDYLNEYYIKVDGDPAIILSGASFAKLALGPIDNFVQGVDLIEQKTSDTTPSSGVLE